MVRNDVIETVIKELKVHGIKADVEPTSRHIAVRWCVEGKEPRSFITSSTPGDWRARLNARATVRQYLRADNVRIKEAATRKTSLAEKVVLPAKQVETIPEQVSAMRAEISDLCDLAVDLLTAIDEMKSILIPAKEVESKRSKRISVLEGLPFYPQQKSTDEVAAEYGIDRMSAYQRLRNLAIKKHVRQISPKHWCRIPEDVTKRKAQ